MNSALFITVFLEPSDSQDNRMFQKHLDNLFKILFVGFSLYLLIAVALLATGSSRLSMATYED